MKANWYTDTNQSITKAQDTERRRAGGEAVDERGPARRDRPSARFGSTRRFAGWNRVDEAIAALREAAAADDWYADKLCDLMARHGREDKLQAFALAGHPKALDTLVSMLHQGSRREDAKAVLRTRLRIDGDDMRAAELLTRLLITSAEADERLELLRLQARGDNANAVDRLAKELVEAGRSDQAAIVARAYARTYPGGPNGRWLLERYGRLRVPFEFTYAHAPKLLTSAQYHRLSAMLRQLAEAGDELAAEELADLVARRDQVDELRSRSAAGDEAAALRLSRLLSASGRHREAAAVLRPHADSGDGEAAVALVELLDQQGRAKAAAAVLRRNRAAVAALRGRGWRGHHLARWGCVDEAIEALREDVDGDGGNRRLLIDLLIERDRTDDAITCLGAWADAGDEEARQRLARLLVKWGRMDELSARADSGDWAAQSELARLLAGQGREEALRARADAGDRQAAIQLIDLLTEQDRTTDLWAEVRAGTTQAAYAWLAELSRHGRDKLAERIRSEGLDPHDHITGVPASNANDQSVK